VAEPDITSTYPPAHHVMRDLRVEIEHRAVDDALCLAPVTEHVRNRSGAASLGLLLTLIDTGGALVALPAAAPDWIATVDLSYHAQAPVTDGPAIAEARIVRVGKNVIVVGVEVSDGHGAGQPDGSRVCGSGLMSFARIPGHATRADRRPGERLGTRMSPAGPDHGLRAPLLDSVGLRVVDAAGGVVEVDKSEYVSNSFGTVNGGVLGMAVQAAAETALDAAGHAFDATDAQIHYLAQTQTGPVRTSARVLRVGGDHAVCGVRAVDAGNDDALLALATITLTG
jgi:acyl-coenzyme A thioesterase PaaI-like protein